MNVRDKILASLNPAPTLAEVEGWGEVYIRTMTAGEIMKAQEDTKKSPGGEKAQWVRFVCRTLCEENGEPVFDVNKTDDVATVNAIPGPILMAFVKVANRINGVDTAQGNG